MQFGGLQYVAKVQPTTQASCWDQLLGVTCLSLSLCLSYSHTVLTAPHCAALCLAVECDLGGGYDSSVIYQQWFDWPVLLIGVIAFEPDLLRNCPNLHTGHSMSATIAQQQIATATSSKSVRSMSAATACHCLK